MRQNFTCPSDKIIKEFYWHPLLGVGDGQSLQNCLKKAKITPSNMSIIEDGKLVWNKEEAESHVYRPDSYCVSSGDKNGWVTFKVCIANCSISPCVRKCCPPSKVIDSTTKKCISATPDWRPIFYRSAGQQDLNTENVGPNASFIVGFPNCPDKYIIERNLTHRKKYVTQSSPKNNFQLLLNGTLVQIDGARHTYIKAGEFCIDGINYKDSKGVDDTMESEVTYSRSEWDQVVIACIPTELRGEIKWRMPLYATLNHISALFLLVTDIVYILLWKHQNIHGWLQFAYATSLFCTFNCFVVVQRWSRELMHTSQSLCKVMGWITHLTYLSAFFWLTSMNFDLWWRFSRPLKSTRLRSQETKWRRFLGFAIFSIVVPLLISGVGITLDYFYEEELLEPPFTIPGFGKEQCYFESKRSQIPYLYGPAGILLLIDMIFFTSTVLHLRKIHAHTELARTQSTMEDKKGLKVILKLFIVMGVLWVFELIKWIAHILLPEEETTLIWIFIPVDILNSLQGVAIFFIFVCKPNVGSQLLALFRKDDPAKTWNKQTQFPSVTVQQPSKQNDFSDIK
ncbi:putative G-protein coupled receptor Mth-like 4 [Orchesella cincta]|uniref:Putative G-protein coupled receptor Mth-like 4 n=1 Tax=Orchesella cincta TaxID=48709 RepID=A0A1D2MLE3_ORCCI|nr:putative G-protein coupled receptor Mth-like 4 [Orchesella cincta]